MSSSTQLLRHADPSGTDPGAQPAAGVAGPAFPAPGFYVAAQTPWRVHDQHPIEPGVAVEFATFGDARLVNALSHNLEHGFICSPVIVGPLAFGVEFSLCGQRSHERAEDFLASYSTASPLSRLSTRITPRRQEHRLDA